MNRLRASEKSHDRPDLPRPRRRRAGRLRPLRRRPAKDLTMIVQLIYAAAALVIGVYMVAALLRPDKF
jgi:nitroreductase